MTTRAKQLSIVGVLTMTLLSGCSSPTAGEPTEQGPSSASNYASAPSSDPVPSASAPQSIKPSLRDQAEGIVDALSVSEQAANLVMAGVPATGASPAEIKALNEQGISNVFLRGRSKLSVAQSAIQVRNIVGALENNAPASLPVWVATDQEGGFVRVLQGAGFSELPTALKQGQWSTEQLKQEISAVAGELSDAGINVNLAPVADVVPERIGTSNAPIGYFGREYAHNASDVGNAITTVNAALLAQGVRPVVKHFPGLGNVEKNTDTSAGVTDTYIDENSADLDPFKKAIEQDQSWVMVSNARYAKLDPKNDAPFSSRIISQLLREQLGYSGIVISDDLCEAKQVGYLPVGERAVKFVAAGGTIPLCVQAAPAVTMAKALASEASANAEFAAQVKEAATLIVEEKLRSQEAELEK